ncbi:predicted protein [Sclerotinia sclerotiorum 1980 UF-70]|uniref:Uncharacterized protein n=1 Tax=Sclerotinia sclerotiorum (strain ATCC 18683 / 1980 / Ss-1) TaxID=665079 RepID=A7F8Z0_SCLS1|nr:predicted protein [Sclerotinia sclerotiorum 1980 UF-70]EDN99211.1 predicted protein [Sclerotinia sclerotiorum 1980 UF-70]
MKINGKSTGWLLDWERALAFSNNGNKWMNMIQRGAGI